MAPALTAEPLSPKEKLTSSASPATGTRQSVRKLEPANSGSGGTGADSGIGSDTVKKPAIIATTTNTTTAVGVGVLAASSTRVTRSKDSAQRTNSPSAVQQPNNKRKANNNNNNTHNRSNNSEVKPSDDQMGLSAAATHTSNDGGNASASSSSGNETAAAAVEGNANNVPASNPVDAAMPAPAAGDEHNNNCKDNSTAELLANLTSDFKETITAEMCLRKTLPDVSLSKEQPIVAGATEATASTVSHDSSSSSGSKSAAVPMEHVNTVPVLAPTSGPLKEPEAEVAAIIASLTSPPATPLEAVIAQSQGAKVEQLSASIAQENTEDASEIHDSIEGKS